MPGQPTEYAGTRTGVVSSGILEFPDGSGGAPTARVLLRNTSSQGVQFSVLADAPIVVRIYAKGSDTPIIGEPNGGATRKGLLVRLAPNEGKTFALAIPSNRLAVLPSGEYRVEAAVSTEGGDSMLIQLGPLFLPLGGPR